MREGGIWANCAYSVQTPDPEIPVPHALNAPLTLRHLLGALTLAVGLQVAPADAARAADPDVAGDVLVKLRSSAELGPLLVRHRLSLAATFGSRPIYRLRLTAGDALAATLDALRAEPGVLLAEPNARNATPEGRKNFVWAIGSGQAYAAQWAPEALRLPQAHALSIGTGVRVAVLDTGVDRTHPALAGRLLPGFDFVDFDTDPSEGGSPADAGWGHGTHVAGLVALAAPGATILPLRVLDPQGQGNAWVLAEALLHAADPDGNPATADGAHVVSMSLGSLNRTELLGAIAKLASCSFVTAPDPADDFTDPGYELDRQRCAAGSGTLLVAAAGNGGSDKERQYPAAERVYGLLAVGATQSSRRLADFSNRGSWVRVAAPGDAVTSTLPGGGFGTWSGTSMAAPLAAGVAALAIARQPALTPTELVRRLERSAASLCDARQVQIDAAAALGAARQPRPACR